MQKESCPMVCAISFYVITNGAIYSPMAHQIQLTETLHPVFDKTVP